MSNPETHTCPDCGYVWRHGQHGGHSCSTLLKARLQSLEEGIAATMEDLQTTRDIPVAISALGHLVNPLPPAGMPYKEQRRWHLCQHDILLSDCAPCLRAKVESSIPDDIRAAGWTVAVHNDYRLAGVAHTFWLFTKGGRNVKGEGQTDAEALGQVRQLLGL